MPKKKTFKKTFNLVEANHLAPTIPDNEMQLQAVAKPKIPPEITNIPLPVEGNETGRRNLDLTPYYGHHYDEVVFYAQHALELMLQTSIKTNGQSLSITTISNYYNVGLKYFFTFCAMWSQALGRDMKLSDVDSNVIDNFITHLASSESKATSQKDYYTKTKSVLVYMGKKKWFEKITFPRNPYPNNNRKLKGQKPLSKPERRQVIRGLKTAYRLIESGTEPLTAYELTVCILIIGLRTGLNPVPICNLTTDCVQVHPIKANRRLLVAYKKRGNATHIKSLRKSQDIESLKTIQMDVLDVIETALTRNAVLRPQSTNAQRLFVFEDKRSANHVEISLFTPSNLGSNTKSLIETYGMTNDDGLPLTLNLSRLRKSFINSIFELSGQDPIVTAKAGGHSLSVSDGHYLEAPKEAEGNFRFMGEVRNQELLDSANVIPIKNIENTPVARCKDTKNGQRAPKNGNYCDDFIGCVRCKSFVVTSEDLYRLYSFYWLIVRERDNVTAKKWSRYYGHVVRIIDSDIAIKFDLLEISEARAKAKMTPHPYWRDISNLEALPA
jgi:hypothetical protein